MTTLCSPLSSLVSTSSRETLISLCASMVTGDRKGEVLVLLPADESDSMEPSMKRSPVLLFLCSLRLMSLSLDGAGGGVGMLLSV